MTEHEVVKLVKEFADVIDSVEVVELTKDEHVSRTKIKLRLLDATTLWIREVEAYESIVAYSYYWLRPNNSIIIGWDNAPHHKEKETFPHHRHIGKNIEPSQQTNIREVMKFIRDFFS